MQVTVYWGKKREKGSLRKCTKSVERKGFGAMGVVLILSQLSCGKVAHEVGVYK